MLHWHLYLLIFRLKSTAKIRHFFDVAKFIFSPRVTLCNIFVFFALIGSMKGLEQYDVKVCRINVTDDIALGERFHVKDLPTMLVFRDGMRVHTTEGIVLPEHYTNLLKFY